MMKNVWGKIGWIIYWLLWPVWVIYFKFSGTRSRVLVIVDNEMLVVQGWLGDASFSLPGGGTKKHETTIASAIRELYEETGIRAVGSSLIAIGKREHRRHGLHYMAEYFVMHLPEKPELKLGMLEIYSAQWVAYEPLPFLRFSDDVLYALKQYP